MNHQAVDWEHDYPHLMHFVKAILSLRECADTARLQNDDQTANICEDTIQSLLRLRNGRKARTDLNRSKSEETRR